MYAFQKIDCYIFIVIEENRAKLKVESQNFFEQEK
jgi:hypothetical protein